MITAKDILQFNIHKVSLQESQSCIYNGSPFQIYKQMSSKKKGARFESIVQEHCTNLGYKVTKPDNPCLLYTSPSPRDKRQSRMPSSA